MQDVGHIRNTVILGHGKSGKTTLAEALLFTSGRIARLGKVDDGSSTMDFEPEETRRNMSLSVACNHLSWQKHEIFFADTPGDDNFVNETRFAVQVADSAVLTIGAVTGGWGNTEKFIEYILERRLPRLLCLTRMDRERADYATTLEEVRAAFPLNPVSLFVPIGAEADFRGVVDLLSGMAWYFQEDGSGKVKGGPVPDDLTGEVQVQRDRLMEYVAETDDDLIEKFLEEGRLNDEELRRGLRKAVLDGRVTPAIPCASLLNRGSSLVLDAMVQLLPAPDDRPAWLGVDPASGEPVERLPNAEAPFSAQVFKTMADPFAGRLTIFRVISGTLSGDSFYNSSRETSERFGHFFLLEGKEQKPADALLPGMVAAVAKLKETGTGDTLCVESAKVRYDALEPLPASIAYAVRAASGDDEKLFAAISRMLDEDLTLKLVRVAQTREVLVTGIGKMHLDVVGERLKRKFGAEMALTVPKVAYRETIRGKARVQGRHKKQSGGRGQFGDCWIEMEPLPRGGGFEFVDKIVGGVIPQQYRPAVEKGIVETMERGVLAGYPMVDVRVYLVDGSYHTVDSSEMAFKVAGSLAFKKAAAEANPVLLEPVMTITIRVPKDCVGDVMGDLNSRRGKVLGMDSQERAEIITAQVPQAEILLYGPDLTSITAGRGSYAAAFDHYDEVPKHLSDKIVEAAAKEE